jgi:hypothetical protein
MTAKFLAIVLIAVLPGSSPAYASCTQGTCVQQPTCSCLDQISDATFDDLCSDWDAGGEAALLNSGSDYYWELYATDPDPDPEMSAYIQQTLTVPSNKTTIAFHIDVDVIDPQYGTERLRAEILSSSGTETLGVVSPVSGSDYYIWNTSGYGGQTVTLRIRYRPAQYPFGTIFRIKEVHFHTC